VVAGIGEDPQKLCENGDEMKVLNCIHLGDCEALNRIDGKEFDCDGCNQYSKFKSLTGNPGKEEGMDHKVCSHCKKEKPATTEYFHKGKKGRFGLGSICKECRSKKWKEKYPGVKHMSPKPKVKPPKPTNNNPGPKIDDNIVLDQQILKAIKKSVANQIVKIIQEAFA